jgi:hypothetical protein
MTCLPLVLLQFENGILPRCNGYTDFFTVSFSTSLVFKIFSSNRSVSVSGSFPDTNRLFVSTTFKLQEKRDYGKSFFNSSHIFLQICLR